MTDPTLFSYLALPITFYHFALISQIGLSEPNYKVFSSSQFGRTKQARMTDMQQNA